ncbi:MAG TPA: hypothetical protein VME40_15920 [Caulobacteraceae bacterium]|nr:hypothetical protein [Caulobacteraceae bacterium]
MSEAYAQHLAALHEGVQAPADLIARAAREVSSSPIAAKARIVHGEANEVYRIAFESGLEVILRIARRAEGIFEKEAWAIGRCRAGPAHRQRSLGAQMVRPHRPPRGCRTRRGADLGVYGRAWGLKHSGDKAGQARLRTAGR